MFVPRNIPTPVHGYIDTEIRIAALLRGSVELNEDDQVCCGCTDHLQKDTLNEPIQPINFDFPITDYTNRIQECPVDPEEATAHYRNTIGHLLSEHPELMVVGMLVSHITWFQFGKNGQE